MWLNRLGPDILTVISMWMTMVTKYEETDYVDSKANTTNFINNAFIVCLLYLMIIYSPFYPY